MGEIVILYVMVWVLVMMIDGVVIYNIYILMSIELFMLLELLFVINMVFNFGNFELIKMSNFIIVVFGEMIIYIFIVINCSIVVLLKNV